MNTDDIGEVWVCTDCYFAHHYGAMKNEREATESEENAWLHGHDDRSIMGLAFEETPEGLMVTEWFAGEDDQRSEGGEPLADLPEYGYESHGQKVVMISDFTCADHEVERLYDEDGDSTGETTVCQWCGQDGDETGIDEFAWRSCDGCNSHLGGGRYRLAIHWETIKEDA